MKGLLDQPSIKYPNKKIIDLIEIADVRVYKVRRTNPRVDMSTLARDAKKKSFDHIDLALVVFIQRFMDNLEFEQKIRSQYHYAPLSHIHIEYGEHITGKTYILDDLKEFVNSQPTVEHIFADKARFGFPNFGFKNIEEYQDKVNRLGNLTLLEKTLNSQCQNKNPDQKISDDFYSRSRFEDPRQISADIKNRGTAFIKEDINERTRTLAKFCLERWDI